MEAGYRRTFANFSLDLSIFKYDYDNDITAITVGDPELRLDQSFMSSHFIQNAAFLNVREYSVKGGEFSFRSNISEHWSVQFTYSYLDADMSLSDWKHIFVMMHSHDLTDDLSLNWAVKYKMGNNPDVDNYGIADLNLRWRIDRHWYVQGIINNIGRDHIENIRDPFTVMPSVISTYGALKVGFSF